MNEEARIAFIQSQIACAMITAMGMQAENQQREALQQSPAYVEVDFARVITNYGIGQNSVMNYLQ